MQTLGLSDSTPRTESRLKSLFWPSVETGNDVDYLGLQGYWVCTLIAVLSFCFLVKANLISQIIAVIVFLLFYLGGVGVRQRSSYAATIVFAMFLLDTAPVIRAGLTGAIVLRVLLLALLFSNARATWIASRWRVNSEEATIPPRLDETWGDKFSNRLPSWLWPKVRYPYYLFSAVLVALLIAGVLIRLFR